jgi:hypothetical protein
MIEEAGLYEVEAILKHRRRHGSLHYYLKWKGYPESENTWEAESNLTCPDLLAAYWQSQQSPSPRPHPDRAPPAPAPGPLPLPPAPPALPADASPLRVLGVTGRRDGVLLLRVLLADGQHAVWGSDFVRALFPNLLVRFYEDHITWLPTPPSPTVG